MHVSLSGHSSSVKKRIPINLITNYCHKVYILKILLYIMDSFTAWMLKGLHAKQEKSRLSSISNTLDWTSIRPILEEMYDSQTNMIALLMQEK
jgi:hypothetical protein